MNLRKSLIWILILYILVLLQTSFFVHFNLFGIYPNFIIILVLFLNLIEKQKNIFSFGFLNATIGGFLLDIFSSRPIGFYIIILAAASVFIKIILKNYVRIPFCERA